MILILKHRGNCWRVADVYIDGKLVHTINKYYKVTDGFITEYEAAGGHDSIHQSDDVIWRLALKDHSLLTIESPSFGKIPSPDEGFREWNEAREAAIAELVAATFEDYR